MEKRKTKIKDALSFTKAGEAFKRLEADRDELIAQRNELLAALKETRFAILVAVGRKSHVENALKMADSAIAKCEVKS